MALSLTPEAFEGQLRWLLAEGYTFLRQAEFEAALANPELRTPKCGHGSNLGTTQTRV